MSTGETIANIFAALVAVEHIYIFVLEAFLWRTRARRVFRTTEEQANMSAVLAANQGFYNLMLVWGIVTGMIVNSQITTLFTTMVFAAASFGAGSLSIRILFVQGLPALLATLLLIFLVTPDQQTQIYQLVTLFLSSLIGYILGNGITRREKCYSELKETGK
eukprot:c7035_g1_i1.p1 GENE.c7035_g1_i1~~c7035_g1_i1.p1  ORF type:complete len:183 (-),score=71.65 c7035_g1_i1:43-528(-)